jgi:hypothetical protein
LIELFEVVRLKPFDQGAFEYIMVQIEDSDFGQKIHYAGRDAIS